MKAGGRRRYVPLSGYTCGVMYEYNPNAWNPLLAGTVAGAIGAIAASLISLPLEDPNAVAGSTLSITAVSLILGVLSGLLWRRLRAGNHALRNYRIGIALGFAAALTALAISDYFVLDDLFPYAVPISLVIFLCLALFTPVLATVEANAWWAAAPLVVALALAIGLIGT